MQLTEAAHSKRSAGKAITVADNKECNGQYFRSTIICILVTMALLPVHYASSCATSGLAMKASFFVVLIGLMLAAKSERKKARVPLMMMLCLGLVLNGLSMH